MKGSRDPLAFNVVQVLATLPIALVVLARMPLATLPPDLWATLVGTAVAHGLYFYWLTRGLETADLSLVYPIARSTPAFLPFVAVPLLGESISPAGALGIATVVAGIWAVQGGALSWRRLATPGAGWAWLTLAATVVYSLLDKHFMARLEQLPWSGALPRAVGFYFLLTASSAICFVPLAARRLDRASLRATWRGEGGRAVTAAAVSFVGYVLILQALRTASVSYVVAARQSSVLFALGLGAVWLRDRPSRSRVLGAFAIVAGVALIAFFA